MRAPFQSSVLCVLAFILGCASEEPTTQSRDTIEVIPALDTAPIDATTVSAKKVTSPRVTLNEGERYDFHKTVEQTLGAEPGSPIARVWEKVDTLMSWTVREVQSDAYLVEVQFLHVRYQSELGDRRISFDSDHATTSPPEALPYKGLASNGFVIVLGEDNTIREVQGYPEFLQRCYREFPAAMQWELIQKMGGYSQTSESRVAAAMSFLDESFALLPFGPLARDGNHFPVGAEWNHEHLHLHPIPVRESLRLSLSHLTDDRAHLSLAGELNTETSKKTLNADGVLTELANGTVTGSCTIDLKTGLPKSSSVHRSYDLRMTALNATPVLLRKSVVTTIETRPVPSP